MIISGSCHCGAVRLEIDRLPATATECNCSICRRYGALWAHCTKQTARVVCAPGTVKPYSWGDRTIEFFHCTHCGCLTHYESVDEDPESRLSVNARMLAPADASRLRIRKLDGANSWTFLDE